MGSPTPIWLKLQIYLSLEQNFMGLMEKKLRGVVSGLGMGWNVPVGCTWKWLKGVHEEDYDITNVKERISIPEDVP